MNSNFKTFKNKFKLFYWIEGIVTKKLALVSSNLDERVKSFGYLKNQGQAILRKKIAMAKRILGQEIQFAKRIN